MIAQKKAYLRLFFKMFLLTEYLAFFSVQLFLRYTSSHSLQSLEHVYQGRILNPLSDSEKSGHLELTPKKISGLSYLNKRFHPEYMPVITCGWDEIRPFYRLEGKFSLSHTPQIPAANMGSMILRGPPTC
jgi:hypothetical protein